MGRRAEVGEGRALAFITKDMVLQVVGKDARITTNEIGKRLMQLYQDAFVLECVRFVNVGQGCVTVMQSALATQLRKWGFARLGRETTTTFLGEEVDNTMVWARPTEQVYED